MARGGEPAEPADAAPSRVMYIGHLPHGFYEQQLKGFFGQFGTVLRVRVSRNKKTGASKHYAFLEFQHAEVARIAAETMDGYLMFEKVLKCHLVPPSEQHEKLWEGANRKFKPLPRQKLHRDAHNKERTEAECAALAKRLLRTERSRRRKIAAAGIEYEFDGYEAQVSVPTAGSKRARETPAEPEENGDAPPPAKAPKKAPAAAAATARKPAAASKPAARKAAAASDADAPAAKKAKAAPKRKAKA